MNHASDVKIFKAIKSMPEIIYPRAIYYKVLQGLRAYSGVLGFRHTLHATLSVQRRIGFQ